MYKTLHAPSNEAPADAKLDAIEIAAARPATAVVYVANDCPASR